MALYSFDGDASQNQMSFHVDEVLYVLRYILLPMRGRLCAVCACACARAHFYSPSLWVSSQDDPEQTGWWWGEKDDGTQGYFPSDYIQLEAEPEAPQHEDNQEKLSSLRSPRYFVLLMICVSCVMCACRC